MAAVKPRRLFIVADGPRNDADRGRCLAARAITDAIDWDCEVTRNYADRNLGCKRRMASGIEWVFGQCEQAIVLEDDAVADPCFFSFCAELLERYRGDERVMMVSGQSFSERRWTNRNGYYFSRFPLIWGWASWARAWRHYDLEMKPWLELRHSQWLEQFLGDRELARGWRDNFDAVAFRGLDTWDYQWTFACWRAQGLVAVPNVNLVTNIGFGQDATHTKKAGSHLAHLRRRAIGFPLRHPQRVAVDRRRDSEALRRMRGQLPMARVKQMVGRLTGWVPREVKAGLRRVLR
ncbi:MAG TPA: glycosyltransferase family 2 protein [Acidobacteriota bacterium]